MPSVTNHKRVCQPRICLPRQKSRAVGWGHSGEGLHASGIAQHERSTKQVGWIEYTVAGGSKG
jgi:hypothetical protein